MDVHVDFLAQTILSSYFIKSYCLIILTDSHFSFRGDIPQVNVITWNNTIPEDLVFNYFGCQDIIIKSRKPLAVFKAFEKSIRLTMERFNYRTYIFIPSCEKSFENILDISKMKELQFVSNLLILYPNFTSINLLTHKYIGRKNNNKLYALDEWFVQNKTFKLSANLFPDKLTKQAGRKVHLATFQYEPYSIVGKPTGEGSFGSEMLSALHFAWYHGMSPEFVINNEGYWGDLFPNWTGNGLMGNILVDNADFGFSALYTWEDSYHYLDLTKPLVRTGITCLVPAPKLAAGWFTPLFSYSYEMWIAVVVLFFSCILTLFLLYLCSTKYMKSQYYVVMERAAFIMSKLFVLQNVTKREMPQGPLGSYFMCLAFVLSLFLSSTYSSGLSSIMTVPRFSHPIDSVSDFAASGIYWGATEKGWVTSIKNAKEPEYVEVVQRFLELSDEVLLEYSYRDDFAFSMERLPNENYAVGAYIQKDVISNYHLMQHDIYWEQCIFMAKKSSILLPKLDMFILKLFEAGLISFWQNQAVSLYMDPSVQRVIHYKSHHRHEKVVTKLKWMHVEGAFAALAFGYVISFLVFLAEVFVFKTSYGKFDFRI